MDVAVVPHSASHIDVSQVRNESDEAGMDIGQVLEDVGGLDVDESIMYPGPLMEAEEGDYLIKPELGCIRGNIKSPVKGFDEEEKQICPLVDRKSAILYDIVQQLEEEELVRSLKLLNEYKKPIIFPRELLDEEEGGSCILIKIADPEEWKKKEEERIIDAELEEQRKILGDLSYVNDTYRVPFDHGWTREVVVRVHPTPPGAELGEYPLTSIGEVFYRDPAGNKIRSMKQIAITLEKDPNPELSIKNFTFGKAPIGIRDSKKEIIRKIISGRHSAPVPLKNVIKGKKVLSTEIMKTNGSNGDSPASIKLKSSSSRRSIQPPKRYATGQAFAYPEKRTKTGTKKDTDYQSDNEMEMGMLPPKYPRGKEDFSGGGSDETVVRRRGRPPTKRVETKETSSPDYNGDHDSALFQISAFHSHSLFDAIKDVGHPHEEMYGTMPEPETMEDRGRSECPAVEQEHGSEELLPCSIRCPAMAGEIPTLQCKRCLCLYHPECLALPPNLNFTNFLCANCEGEHVDDRSSQNKQISMQSTTKPSATAGSTGAEMSRKPGWFGPKLGESMKVKKPPPPLLPAFPKFTSKFGMMNSKLKVPPQRMNIIPTSLGRSFPSVSQPKSGSKMMSSVSLLRPTDDSMSISPITMKRGRGRPPKSTRLLPNLSNRNLTITPISIRPRLPVPSLTPMSKGKSLQMPLMPPKFKGSITQQASQKMPSLPKIRPSIPTLSVSGAQKRHRDSIFRDLKGVKAPPPPVSLINKGPGGFPPFKRHVQSVVSIGTRKFVAVPRGAGEVRLNAASKPKITTKNSESVGSSETEKQKTPDAENFMTVGNMKENNESKPVESDSSSHHNFDKDDTVIKQIFKYLNVKDLLRAARVSRLWNKVASEENLWKVVRMKNQRISDVSTFCEFLRRQKTEQLDLRKMISTGDMDWDNLFQNLGSVPSLRQIILGPRTVTAERVASLSQLCPNLDIVTT